MIRFYLFSLLVFAVPALAQTPIYRCGTLYTNRPCPGATVVEIEKNQNVISAPVVILPSETYAESEIYFYPYPIYIGGGGYATSFNFSSSHSYGQRYRYSVPLGRGHGKAGKGEHGGSHSSSSSSNRSVPAGSGGRLRR